MNYYESALFIVMNKTLLSMVIINYICHQKRNLGGVLRGSYFAWFLWICFYSNCTSHFKFQYQLPAWILSLSYISLRYLQGPLTQILPFIFLFFFSKALFLYHVCCNECRSISESENDDTIMVKIDRYNIFNNVIVSYNWLSKTPRLYYF